MKVLVTGRRGQVGSELAGLNDAEYHVTAFDRSELDVTRSGSIERRIDEVEPDLIVNCAAYTAVDLAENEPQLAYAVNADALDTLGRICRRRGISIVHLSTDYVFDGRKAEPYHEDDPPNPLGVYGASKLAGEELLRNAIDQHIILRVSWVFGRLGRSFVDTILRLARERDTLSVVDDQIGAPSPATAIAQTIRRFSVLASNSATQWGTYHFTTTPALSWCAFARRIVSLAVHYGVLDRLPQVRPIASGEWPSKVRRPQNSRLDGQKAAAAFQSPAESWEPHLHAYLRSLGHHRGKR
ncbi:MAG: dTDP-4-dehydrorhamnose reductase [Gammaproteobacteria bacterium]|nr:dTDP-4-dehydrorhamnose reductase [Gammaproteobacteria bacterium]